MRSLRVVFMGTPEFAVASLGSLLMNGYNVIGVVTAPDKPAGRGMNILEPAVKKFAKSSCLPVYQPENLKDQAFVNAMKSLQPDIFVVVAFRMLPESVWRIPRKGTINLHGSLLPQYRGAAPINHAIINGENITGVTTFLIDDKIDTGNILMREEVHISPCENAGDLHDKLMKHGARLIIKTLEAIERDQLTPHPQTDYMIPGEILKTAPKIFPGMCVINWDEECVKIHNLIRGLAPLPCARTYITNGDKTLSLRIYESHPEIISHTNTPGQIVSDGKTFLKIACRNGFINILNLQAEGKKRLSTVEFLRGFRIEGFKAKVSQQV